MESTTEAVSKPPLIIRPPRGWIRCVGVILALTGWWFSFDLVRLSIGQSATNPWLEQQCGQARPDAAPTDCGSVLASEWASFPLSEKSGLRMPVAVLGMAYFALLAIWFGFVGPPTRKRWAWHLPIVFIILCGLAQSAYMMHLMGNVLHQWCSGCVAAHTVNGLLGLLALIAFPWRRDKVGQLPFPTSRLALVTGCAGFFLMLVHALFMLSLVVSNLQARLTERYLKITKDPAYACWQYERQPKVEIAADPQRPPIGQPDAAHTVVIFFDAQCSACELAHELLAGLLREYPALINVDYRHYPHGPCNESIPASAGPTSCEAAYAMEAARMLAGGDGLAHTRELVGVRRHELAGMDLTTWASDLGLDPEQFREAMRSEAVEKRVHDDIELAKKLGINATPVVYLDGRQVEHWRMRETWETLLGVEPTPESQPADTAAREGGE